MCVCLFVALRLRGVERRGHTEPVTKLIRQIPATSETFSQLRSSARAVWTAPPSLSFVCCLFASYPPHHTPTSLSLASGPCTFFWLVYSTCCEIFMPCKNKVKGTEFWSKQKVKWECARPYGRGHGQAKGHSVSKLFCEVWYIYGEKLFFYIDKTCDFTVYKH